MCWLEKFKNDFSEKIDVSFIDTNGTNQIRFQYIGFEKLNEEDLNSLERFIKKLPPVSFPDKNNKIFYLNENNFSAFWRLGKQYNGLTEVDFYCFEWA
jgi:hypothetical protein